MFPFPSKVIALTPANGIGAAFADVSHPVSVSAKVPLKLATEHPLSLAFAAGAAPSPQAAMAAMANVFAMLLCFMIVSFVVVRSREQILVLSRSPIQAESPDKSGHRYPKFFAPVHDPTEITTLLKAWGGGDQDALDQLAERVYGELRAMARRYLKNERPDNTLQTTALVHEVYLRMVGAARVEWHQRAQFFGMAAQMMRRVLVDAARARRSHKRGGQAPKVNLDETAVLSPERDRSVLALDDALAAFSEVAPRQAKVVELRYFGGLTEEEIVSVLNISPRTVRRDWDLARAWLLRELKH